MKTYPLFKAHIPSEEALSNIKDVFTSGFINEGIQVTQLQEALKEKLQAENLILTNSCTSAITLALKLCGVDHNSSVITTPMTCVATNTPIVNLGAEIIWCDINQTTGMIDPQVLEQKIKSRSAWGPSNTKAVIVVAWAGTPPELFAIKNVCQKANIPLILDAAHAFGATYYGAPIHVVPDITCYSFQAIKHFTTGDGGALVCNIKNTENFNRAKALKWFGLDRDTAKDASGNWKGQQWDVDIIEAGYKFNMNNMSAALGLAQLKYIDKIINTHRNNAMLYDQLFNNNQHISYASPAGAFSSSWVHTMLLNDSSISRDKLLELLNNEGIMAGVVHVPNDNYTAFAEFKTDLPGVKKFSNKQFSLPCGWWLDEDDIKHIANRVIELTK